MSAVPCDTFCHALHAHTLGNASLCSDPTGPQQVLVSLVKEMNSLTFKKECVQTNSMGQTGPYD